jgi:hypothetical protein
MIGPALPPRVQVPLSLPLRSNIAYAIRLDSQIREGGVGLYSEQGDRGTLSGDLAVIPLRAKSPSSR